MFEKMKEVLQQRLAGTHEEEALRQPKRKFLLVESDREFRDFVRDYVMDTPYHFSFR